MSQNPSRTVPRKRTRKRKRRAAPSSSSSSLSSDSDSDIKVQSKPAPIISQVEGSSSSEWVSSSGSDNDSDAPAAPAKASHDSSVLPKPHEAQPPASEPPSEHPYTEIPPFLDASDPKTREAEEEALKAKFKKFWMASIAEGFKDDLEEIRKNEPNLTTSRLALLIDSLASGADVFTSNNSTGTNEMEIVMDMA